MRLRHAAAALAVALVACARPQPGPTSAEALPLVVTPAWLAEHLADPDLVLLHVGDVGAYRAEHIPGARHAALSDISFSAPDGAGRVLEVPPPDDLRRRLEDLGISTGSRVVVYTGQDWISPATRVIFTLDQAGLGARAALLDGGMAAWVRAGHPTTDAAVPARKGTLAPLAMRSLVVDATSVLASLGKPGVAVVDARHRPLYDGTETGGSDEHPHARGHIRGALSLPFDSVFDEKQALRSPEELTALFARAGVEPGDHVIGYCHIGQQATAMLFAARRLGYPVQLYDGSFEDWSLFHPGYPVENPAEVGP